MYQRCLAYLLSCCLLSFGMQGVHAQYVGIGTLTPTAPLSFQSVLGKKIVLNGNGNAAHTGIGVQSGFLQFYLADANAKFHFGQYEQPKNVMTITGMGEVGFNNATPLDKMHINGDLRLRWGANPAIGPGVYIGAEAQSPEPWFVGLISNSDIGAYWSGTNPGNRLYWNITYGSMGVNGDVGAVGNLLVSGGPNAPTAWSTPQYLADFNTLSNEVFETTPYTISANNSWLQMTGLSKTQTYSKPTKVAVHFNVAVASQACCSHIEYLVVVDLNGGGQKQFRYYLENGTTTTVNGSMMLQVPAGSQKISIAVLKQSGPDLTLPANQGVQSSLILQAMPGY